MNKLNYLTIPAIIILLISSALFCFNLSKQNSDFERDFKKEISELRKEQVEQKEDMENLRELLILSWKEYRDYDIGFSFRYPANAEVCEDGGFFEKTVLSLGIRFNETCAEGEESQHPAQMYFTIGENAYGYQTAEEAFYKEYAYIDKSINPQLGYFKIGGLDAYGGGFNSGSNDEKNVLDGYRAMILKNNYIVNINGGTYEDFRFLEGKSIGKKPMVDAVISSFDFYNQFLEDWR